MEKSEKLIFISWTVFLSNAALIKLVLNTGYINVITLLFEEGIGVFKFMFNLLFSFFREIHFSQVVLL